MSDPIKYEYPGNAGLFELSESGIFTLNKKEMPWYKNTENQKPWIPAKRKSFVSAVKMAEREGDFK